MEIVPNIKGETLIDFAKKASNRGQQLVVMPTIPIERLKELVLSMSTRSTMPKKVQTIYIGYIRFFRMQKRLLVVRFTGWIQASPILFRRIMLSI